MKQSNLAMECGGERELRAQLADVLEQARCRLERQLGAKGSRGGETPATEVVAEQVRELLIRARHLVDELRKLPGLSKEAALSCVAATAAVEVVSDILRQQQAVRKVG